MKSRDYWTKRAAQVAAGQFQSAEEYNSKLLKEYEKAIASIQRDMEVFYQRFANNNGIVDMAEARKILNSYQLKEFKLSLEDFIALARDNADGRWTKMLNNAYYKQRITRFEALQLQIQQQIEMLMGSRQAGLNDLLSDTYSDNYYRMVHAIEQGTGIKTAFTKLDAGKIESVLKMNYEGSNWSKRIWNDRDKLTREVYTKLSQAFIRGDSIDRTTQDIAKAMNSSYKRAYRLTHTEATFFSGQATVQSYKDTGVEKYEFMASHNERTCDTCGALDGKVFKVSEQEPGINMQPMHAHCHCTTAPWFEDEFNEGTGEIEKTKSGKTYEDWKQERINDIGQEEWNQRQKMIQNEASDKEQYKKYKEVLGSETPKTFDKFRDLKYNKAEEYSILKAQYKGMGYYNKAVSNEPEITEHVKNVASKVDMSVEGLQYRLKTKESYLGKIRREYEPGNNTYEIKDIIRYTYTAAPGELTEKTLTAMEAHHSMGYNTSGVKNYWLNKNNPYNGINTTVQAPNGQKFEVQYHTPESFAVKNGEMHRLYEEWRILPRDSDERIKLEADMKKLSDSMVPPDGIERVK